MIDRKQNVIKSPDLTKLQMVVIDQRTKIYIAHDADPEEARSRYFNRLIAKGTVHPTYRKPSST